MEVLELILSFINLAEVIQFVADFFGLEVPEIENLEELMAFLSEFLAEQIAALFTAVFEWFSSLFS